MNYTLQQLPNYNKILLPLEVFILIVNKTTNSKIDVTTSVHGHLIAGQLVLTTEHYKELKRTTLSALKQKDDADIYHQLPLIFEMIINVQDTDKENNMLFNHVCIKNHVFLLGNVSDNTYPVDGLSYWIGKLESVDRFALEELVQR